MRGVTLIAALCFAAALFGCAKTVELPPSSDLPAATGEVKVSKDDNNNTRLDLKVQHFAPPQRLQPPKSLYVVWVKTPNGEMHNVGQLNVNDDLEGELKATTPYEVFVVVITAENFATVTQPSQQVVLTTRPIRQN